MNFFRGLRSGLLSVTFFHLSANIFHLSFCRFRSTASQRICSLFNFIIMVALPASVIGLLYELPKNEIVSRLHFAYKILVVQQIKSLLQSFNSVVSLEKIFLGLTMMSCRCSCVKYPVLLWNSDQCIHWFCPNAHWERIVQNFTLAICRNFRSTGQSPLNAVHGSIAGRAYLCHIIKPDIESLTRLRHRI